MWVKTESNSIIPPKFFDTVPELVHWAEATPGLDAMRVYNTNGEPIQSMAYGIFRFSMMLKSGMTVAVSHLSGQNIVFTPVPGTNDKTILEIIMETSYKIHDGRTVDSIFKYVIEEVGELSTELNIIAGQSNKKPGKDGVVGEAMDAILCLVDLIKVFQPDISMNELLEICVAKCAKWEGKHLTIDKPLSISKLDTNVCPECQGELFDWNKGIKCTDCDFQLTKIK